MVDWREDNWCGGEAGFWRMLKAGWMVGGVEYRRLVAGSNEDECLKSVWWDWKLKARLTQTTPVTTKTPSLKTKSLSLMTTKILSPMTTNGEYLILETGDWCGLVAGLRLRLQV